MPAQVRSSKERGVHSVPQCRMKTRAAEISLKRVCLASGINASLGPHAQTEDCSMQWASVIIILLELLHHKMQ